MGTAVNEDGGRDRTVDCRDPDEIGLCETQDLTNNGVIIKSYSNMTHTLNKICREQLACFIVT